MLWLVQRLASRVEHQASAERDAMQWLHITLSAQLGQQHLAAAYLLSNMVT